jgi:cell wall-associated NlpC family hydrolase
MNIDDAISAAKHVRYLPGGRDLNGWDCYGAVRWLYTQITGIWMPEYPAISHQENFTTQRAALQVHDHVEPCDFEPLAFAAQYRGRRWVHIGLVLPDRTILHAYEGLTITAVHRRHRFEQLAPITKYYRWKSENGDTDCLS